MINVLFLGFLIGLRHALEVDHVMAVAALTTSKTDTSAIRQGVAWGIGHTLTLLAVGGVFLFIDTLVPEHVAQILEFTVGIMLLVLGADVIHQIIYNHLHIHTHLHTGGVKHIHPHSHLPNSINHPKGHHHKHINEIPMRALLVGFMHGLAGSGALILLTLQSVRSPVLGVFYLMLFGIGSIIGMAILTTIITIPMKYSLKNLSSLYFGLRVVIGISTVILGMFVMYDIGVVEGLIFN